MDSYGRFSAERKRPYSFLLKGKGMFWEKHLSLFTTCVGPFPGQWNLPVLRPPSPTSWHPPASLRPNSSATSCVRPSPTSPAKLRHFFHALMPSNSTRAATTCLECVWFVPFPPLICQFVHEIFISAGPVPRTVPEKKKDSINISWIGSNGLKWNELHCTALETQGSGRTACPIQLWGWAGSLPQYHKGWWQACKLTVHTNRSCLSEIIHELGFLAKSRRIKKQLY